MKKSLVTSTALHVLVLSWGLFSLSGPEPLDAGLTETLPVDIVPVSELTQIQRGERDAPMSETAAPEPTEPEEPAPDAQNVGSNTVDLDSAPTPNARPETVEEAAAPEPAEEPRPDPEPTPEPETQEAVPAPPPQPAEAPEPEPEPQEMAALPEPAEMEEPAEAPEPLPEAETPEASAPAEPEEQALPDTVPTPLARPEPPRPPAEAPREPVVEEPPQQAAEASSARESDFDADEISALLNRQEASGGGQLRSQEQASLGGRTETGGETLSQSELDALRGQIQRCWNIVPGMADGADVRVQVSMRLAPDGSVDGQPGVTASGGSDLAQRTLSGSALRAVLRCAPYSLPAEKYDVWSEVVVNFDPSQMF